MLAMERNLRKMNSLHKVRHFSRLQPPSPSRTDPVIRVSNNIAFLSDRRESPKPRQLLSLPPFPLNLPGKKLTNKSDQPVRVTAVSWLKYYFPEVSPTAIQSHFNKGLVQMECSNLKEISGRSENQTPCLKKINCNEVMIVGAKVYVPVSIAESRISKRYDTIPSGSLYPNADEIQYLQRLVMYRDSAIIVLNKPPRLPVKGHLPVHNSMDALASAALCYGNEEGPKLVHRLDRESSGILLMGRTRESTSYLTYVFSGINRAKSSLQSWNDACEFTAQRYWALVIGSPKEKEGIINAPLSKVLLNDGKTERVILAHPSGIDGYREALTKYRTMGPTINGCTWLELHPLTGLKHQLRVHCAEALGTPIVGDYKYGWFIHKKWKQMPRIDYEPTTGKTYKLRRPEGLAVQKGSVLSKVPLLHLHCRELVLPNIEKFLQVMKNPQPKYESRENSKPNVLRFVASMPSHMKISWNLMSSYLV